MGLVLLEKAANLLGLVATGQASRLGLLQFEAALECSERLNSSGYPEKALDLVDSMLPSLPAEDGRLRIRLEIQALRALMLSFRDSECLERVTASTTRLAPLAEQNHVDYLNLRAYEGIALLRMNRVTEGIERLNLLASV